MTFLIGGFHTTGYSKYIGLLLSPVNPNFVPGYPQLVIECDIAHQRDCKDFPGTPRPKALGATLSPGNEAASILAISNSNPFLMDLLAIAKLIPFR